MVYPSAEFQEAVIRKAYHEANLEFSGTDYIECHGTGTELGDVVELTALASCFSPGRSSPLKIGGVSDFHNSLQSRRVCSLKDTRRCYSWPIH